MWVLGLGFGLRGFETQILIPMAGEQGGPHQHPKALAECSSHRQKADPMLDYSGSGLQGFYMVQAMGGFLSLQKGAKCSSK